MDVFEAMGTARAMRFFKPDPVPADLLEKVLWAATRASSPNNTQAWGFIVVQDPAIRRRMGMLYQFGALFTDLSVFDNVAFPLREHTHLNERLIRDIVLMKLEAVGLRGARDLMPSEISGGMARRVALARAIALDP